MDVFEKKVFAMEVVPKLQVSIGDFTFCAISVLKKDVLCKVIEDADCEDAATLIFEMTNSFCFELLAVPGDTFHKFDVITRFGVNYNAEYALGKDDEERVAPVHSKRKRDAY